MGHLLNGVNSLWIFDIFNKLCLVLDAIIYTVAGWLFNTFYSLAGMSIINEFKSFALIFDRIKLLIGIFALFILVKSLLANLIDPDKAVVESSKIVKNIGIAIVLLITIPEIFNILNGFQTAVVGSNAIPKLVLNEEMVENAQVEDGSFVTMNNVGNILMNNVFLLFFKYKGFEFGDFTWTTDSNLGGLFKDLGEALSGIESEAFDAVGEGAPILVLFPYTNSSNVYYEYPVISGIVGLVFCYYFIQIAVTIGIRMFKLIALQVIAPIPIILSINPSQHSTLSNYFKYLSKTYSDLFIRLFCVMLVYPVIFALVKEIEPETGNLVIKLILIFALLKFVKEVPKMLSEILNLNIKMSEKGPGGFLGGIFGTGIGLASGAIASNAIGLKGKDFALHTLATGFKGGVSGRKGGQQGLVGFGKSVVGGTANSYVDATQIYSTGGYGNWLKSQMYEKTGQTKIFAQQREKLSDAVTNTKQRYDSLFEQQKRVRGLKETARTLYDEANNGGIKNSYAYKNALQIKSDALKNHDKNAYNKATSALQVMDAQYNRAVEKFYNNASSNSTSAQAVTLANIKEQIKEESRSVDSTFDISKYENIDKVANGYNLYVDNARAERDQAIKDLNDFKNKKEVQIANRKLENNNKYTSNSNARSGQQSQRQTGSGQQGRGQTGGGQRNRNN